MSGIFRRLVGYSSGRTDLPKLQRDSVVDDGTIGLFDFGHGWGYLAQVGPVAAGAQLRNYDRDGGIAVADAAIPWSGGMVKFDGLGQSITLPAEWKLPPSTTDFAISMTGRIPRSGYPSGGTGQKSTQILGCASGGVIQYSFLVLYDAATGQLSGLQLGLNNEGPVVPAALFPDDAAAHHYALRWRATSATASMIEFYIDGALRFTAAVGYAGALSQPDRPAKLGQYWNFVPDAMRGAIGRVMLQRLDVAGSKPIGELIAADLAAGQGRFS
ncbi:hypothetical protein [Sphingomonas parapaucimobilis]|uniref:LamG-like jellyroll fold domain-containing protein n=1 Tax=Sphingomonas parapaucimobilis NBRC 15100 TaxID=1219049 RepID=A0A0A1W6M5_9SPHN|nr:hypothetical protein [Sphingomonas parapaucimobilis]GAM00574.1 hypothetical protein SP5_034_01490 [Sphingomonas parapaucimobilis NBRC 15100]